MSRAVSNPFPHLAHTFLFSGKRCEFQINYCAAHVCLNGGTCMNREGGASCICKPGYFGAKCESDVNECASNPCRNGGTCLDQENRYTCQCPQGIRGKFCEQGGFFCPTQVLLQRSQYMHCQQAGYRVFQGKQINSK